MIKKNSPLVSIVLPSYNGEKFLEEAIESVINQTYKNWELILVDDGSKDKTPEIMKKYSKKYKNIFFHPNPKNCRLPKTLNNGFSYAKGSYYTWISDDNIFKKDAIKTMVNAIVNNPNIDVIYTNYDTIDENGSLLSKELTGDKIEKIKFHYIIGPCFLLKPECHNKIRGYNTDYKMCEDYDYFLRMYYEGFKFKHLDDSLFLFRKHSGAMSANIEGLVLNTEKAIISNAIINTKKISRKDLSKIYIDRFCKNIFKLKLDFLLKGFIYHPVYTFLKIPKIFKRLY